MRLVQLKEIDAIRTQPPQAIVHGGADVVGQCLTKAKSGASADDIDRCVTSAPAATIDPLKAALLALGGIGLAVALFAMFRSARRRIDPVAQAGQKLHLAVQQGDKETVVTGDYKGYVLRIEPIDAMYKPSPAFGHSHRRLHQARPTRPAPKGTFPFGIPRGSAFDPPRLVKQRCLGHAANDARAWGPLDAS